MFSLKKLLIVWSSVVLIYYLIPFQLSATAQIENLNSLIESGRYDSAERLLLTLKNRAELPEEINDINHRLGELYYQYTHQYSQALVAFEEIISLSGSGFADDRFLAKIKRGDVFCRLGRHDEAIQSFRSLLEFVPPDHFAHQTARLRIRRIQDALIKKQKYHDLLKQSFVPRINNAGTKFRIADLFRQSLNQPQKAIDYYQQVLLEFPESQFAPESLWRIGNLYNQVLHKNDLAITAYEQVVNQYPSCSFAADSIYQTALIYCQANRFRLARTHLKRVINHYPSFWKMYAVFYWLGVACESSGKAETADYRSAIKAYKTFVNLYLPDLEPANLGELAKHQLDKQAISAQLNQKITQLEVNLPAKELHYFESVISAQNFSAALNIGYQIIADFPTTQYAEKVKKQLPKIAKQAAIQQLQKTAKCPQTLLQIGAIYEHELKNLEPALDVYGQLVKTYPESDWVAEALYRMGLIYLFEYKNISQAIQLYSTLTHQYSSSVQAMQASFQLGEIYRHLQQFDLALPAYQLTTKHIEQELYLGDGFQDSFADQAEFRIAVIHYQKKDWDSALTSFQDFLRNRPNSPRFSAACTYLGLIYQSTKQKQKAIAAWQRAISFIQLKGPIQSQMVEKELRLIEGDNQTQFSRKIIEDKLFLEPITASRTSTENHRKNKVRSSDQEHHTSHQQVLEWLQNLKNR